MSNVIVGVLAIVAGLVFCFRGYLAMRTVIAVWGAFVGLGLGAAVYTAATGQPALSGALSWIAAIVGALLLGWLAYAIYAVAVVLTMGSVGYALGSGIAALLGASGWVLVVAGFVGAGVLVVVALATDLPQLLLIIVTAIGGASAIVFGWALLLYLLPLSLPGPDAVAPVLGAHWWLNVVFLALAVAGVVTQLRRRATADLRASYR